MRYLYIPVALVFIFFATVIWTQFKTDLDITDSIIAYSTSFISLYSLVIAILEIISLKSISEITKETVKRTEDTLFKQLKANELGKSIELLPYIKSALIYNDIGRAISNLEKLSNFYCSIFDVKNPPGHPKRNTFDIIHATIDRLEINVKYKTSLSKKQIEKMVYDISQIQIELKIESNKRMKQ